MPLRQIQGIVHSIRGQPLANATITISLVAPFAVDDILYPRQSIRIVTDATGVINVTLAVPTEGAARYVARLPEEDGRPLFLDAGDPIGWAEVLAMQADAVPYTLTQALFAQHTAAPDPHPQYITAGDLGVLSGDARYRHVQSTPSALWTIVHNLGKQPSLSVVDTSGQVVIGDVTYTNLNTIVVQFSAPFSGEAYAN